MALLLTQERSLISFGTQLVMLACIPESWIKEEKLEFNEERRASGVRGTGCTPPKYGALSLRIYAEKQKNNLIKLTLFCIRIRKFLSLQDAELQLQYLYGSGSGSFHQQAKTFRTTFI
jgi:hypothetical protein